MSDQAELDEEIPGLDTHSEFGDEDTVDVAVDIHEVIAELERDKEFFIEFYLAEHLKYTVPYFHCEMLDLMVDMDPENNQLALAIPRGHAKTTMAKLSVVWSWLFTGISFQAYVSNTLEMAAAACRDIMAFIQSDNSVALFGAPDFECEGGIRREAQGLYVFKWRGKNCTLRALGAGQQVRGINYKHRRPERTIVDDLEDDDNTATPLLRKKLRTWFFGAFLKAHTRPIARIIFIGNLLSDKSILNELCNSARWRSVRIGAVLLNGEPLWPDIWSLEALKADLLEYQRLGQVGRWFAEMMNLPIPDASPLILSEEIHYQPQYLNTDIKFGFITVDPAISLKSWSDNTAIAAHGYDGTAWQIVEKFTGKVDPGQLFTIICDFCTRWRFNVVGVEATAYQAALEYFFNLFKVAHGFAHLEFIPLRSGIRKTERLTVWATYLRNKEYCLPDGDIAVTEQLLMFDPTKRDNSDDLIDACAYGPQMIEQYLPLIIQEYMGISNALQMRGCYETAGH